MMVPLAEGPGGKKHWEEWLQCNVSLKGSRFAVIAH